MKRRFIRTLSASLAAVFFVVATFLLISTSESAPAHDLIFGKKDTEHAYVLKVLRDHSTGLTRSEEDMLASFIVEESRQNGLDPLFVMALIKTESTFYNWARSHKGALGLMQVLPSTGESMAGELSVGWDGEKTLYDPYLNVRLGIKYYIKLKSRFSEDTLHALAAYNWGPSYLSKRIRRGKSIPKRYGKKVLANYSNLKEGRRL